MEAFGASVTSSLGGGSGGVELAFSTVEDLLDATAARLGVSDLVRDKWLTTLSDNLYDSCYSVAEINAEEWAAMKLPMRAHTVVRLMLGPMIEASNDAAFSELLEPFVPTLLPTSATTAAPPPAPAIARPVTAPLPPAIAPTGGRPLVIPLPPASLPPPPALSPTQAMALTLSSSAGSSSSSSGSSTPAPSASQPAASSGNTTPTGSSSSSSKSRPIKPVKQRSFLSFDRFRQSSDETLPTAAPDSIERELSASSISEDSTISPRDDDLTISEDQTRKSSKPRLIRNRSISKLLNMREKLEKNDGADSVAPTEAESEKFNRVLHDVRELKKSGSARVQDTPVVSVVGDASLVFSFLSSISHDDVQDGTVFLKLQECGTEVSIKFKDNSAASPEEALSSSFVLAIYLFSVIDTRSLNNVITKFLPYLKQDVRQFPRIPSILVGHHADKREDGERKHVNIEQAQQVRNNFTAYNYFEVVSDASYAGIMQDCARAVLREQRFRALKGSNSCSIKIQKAAETSDSELVLQKSKLEMIPTNVMYLRQLIRLRLDHNNFKYFPTELYLLPKLQELDLSDNLLTEIPEDIDRFTSLVKLDLQGNKLDDLPIASLQRIPGLIEVRLKNNPLSRVPKALISRRYYLVLSSNVRKESGALLLSTSNSGSSLRPTSPQPPSDECSLFGSDLETILAADRRRDPKLRIPFIAKHSINFILTTGMEVQGIFRLEGNAAAMAALREQAEAGDFVFDRMESPNNVAGLLKQWLRSLSRPPLIDLPAFLSIVDTDVPEQQHQRAEALLSSLPEAYYELIAAILHMLNITCKNSEINKMEESVLARVMSSNLIWAANDNQQQTPELLLQQLQKTNDAMQYLIEHYESLVEKKRRPFEDCTIAQFNNPFAVFQRKLLGGQKSITCVCLAQPVDGDCSNPPASHAYTSPYSRIWVADEKGIIQIWNSKDLFMVRQLDAKRRVNSMLNVDDTVWVGTIESIQIRNASDGELVREITTPGYNFVRVGNSVWSSIWSGTAGQIRIYNIGTMKVKTEFSIATRISSLVAVGEQVWGACQDRKIRIWSAKSLELVTEINTPHEEKLNGLCVVSSDDNDESTVWSTSDDQTICVWRCQDLSCVAKLDGYHKKQITGATRIGKQVWSFGWESDIHVWDAKTREHQAKLHSYHSQPISDIKTDWSPVAMSWRVYSVSYDHSANVWRCREADFA